MTGRPMVPIFRPPYMDYNTTVQEQAYRAGFTTMALWTVDTQDALGADARDDLQRAIKGKPGQIILMHAGPARRSRPCRASCSTSSRTGYTFVNLPEMFGIPWSPTTTGRSGRGEPAGGDGGGNVCAYALPDDDNQLYWTGPGLRPQLAHLRRRARLSAARQ